MRSAESLGTAETGETHPTAETNTHVVNQVQPLCALGPSDAQFNGAALHKTQAQMSTGLKVSEASHNPASWATAVKIKSDIGALGAVRSAIGQSVAMLDTFASALNATLVALNKVKQAFVTASPARC